MDRDLDAMVVAITGASSGIGRALAIELAGRGAHLVLGARRTDRLTELARILPGDHLTLATDVAREDDCHRFIQRTQERFGRIDTLVCNAGRGLLRPAASTSRQEWTDILAVNLLGTMACIEEAMPLMRAQPLRQGWRGQVIIVSSCLARRSIPNLGAYSATKAAQLSIAEAMRVEERDSAIAVTSVHPVGTATEFDQAAETVSETRMGIRSRAEVRQQPEDVARAIAKAIVRPTAEVWPHWPSRVMFGCAGLSPGLYDRLIRRFGRSTPPPA